MRAIGTYNGPEVVSNEYNEEKQMYVMEFDNDVTILGDINFNEKTADGPFFVTYQNQESGIACNVETIILPKTVNRIGDLAFFGCADLASVTIPNSVTSIGDRAFAYCSGLISVTIPNSVETIREWAFSSCTNLTSVTIPNSVISIKHDAFYGCTSLTSVTIPNSVNSIEYNAFYNCTGLTSVTCEATTPPTCGTAVFDDTNDCPIYVPAGLVDTYKAAENWSTYASRIQVIQ